MPQSVGAVRDGWDTDSAHVAQNHTIHTAYEPLTSPRIAIDKRGVRHPVASELLPRLAESWEGSADARSWTVRLRPGVRSDAGNELTAEDVRWSWERAYALRRVGRWRSRRECHLWWEPSEEAAIWKHGEAEERIKVERQPAPATGPDPDWEVPGQLWRST